MENKNNISLIIFISLILFSLKWIYSFVIFPEEEITLKVISESASDSYFHYVKVLSELDFNNDYFDNKNEFLLLVPIGSIIFHTIMYKIIGIYSFIVLELIFIFLFLLIFSSILNKFNFSNYISIFLAVLIFSLPTIDLLNPLSSILYNLKFPRPMVTNLYLFSFLYFIVNIYYQKLFTIKNIYIIGIFFSLLFSSSFFIFLPLCFFLLIFILRRNKFENIFEKLKEFRKHLLTSFFVFLLIISSFIFLMVNSSPDYDARMGIINISIEDKIFLLKYYINRLFIENGPILIIFPILSFLITKKYFYNKQFFIVEVFFLNYICAFINPFIFILISNKVAFLNHINNLIVISFFLYFFILSIYGYKFLTDNFNFLKPKKLLVTLSIFVLIIFNIFNTNNIYQYLKNDNQYRIDKNNALKQIKFQNKNCNILTFDNSIMSYLILNEFKNLLFLNGTFTDRSDKVLESDLINSLKIFNFKESNFEELLQSDWDGWRLKNSRMQQLFWQKYQANSFFTYNNTSDFKESEIKIINITSPSIVHQFVIPLNEKKRLLKKFTRHNIIKQPDFIIIVKKDQFWSDQSISKNNFSIILHNENFKIYRNNFVSSNCK